MSNGFDEQRLFEKLRRIEALFAGATTEGERLAADAARERIRERLQALSGTERAEEHRFSLRDTWSRRIFIALLRRYGIEPYRLPGQRYTTVMARVSSRFVDETLWPEFLQIHAVLTSYLDDVTNRVLTQMIHGDVSEAAVVSQPMQLGAEVRRAGTAPGTDEDEDGADEDDEGHEAGSAGRPTSAGTAGTGGAATSAARRKRGKQSRKR
jgi:hypothetical protein